MESGKGGEGEGKEREFRVLASPSLTADLRHYVFVSIIT